MERSVRWLCVGTGVRVGGYSMVVSFFFLYLRNVYGLAYDEIGILVAITGILPLAILPSAGLLTDRVGRRRVFLVALLAEACALLLLSEAMQVRSLLGLLVFVTLLQTVGALGGPAVQAYVADLTQGSERTVAFTWVRVGGNLGFTVGVLSGGVLIGGIGFAAVTFFAGLLILTAVVILAILLEASPYERQRTPSGNGLPAPERGARAPPSARACGSWRRTASSWPSARP